MEAGILLRSVVPLDPPRRRFTFRRRSIRVFLNPQRGYQGPKPKKEWVSDWVSKNDDVVRSLPICIGGLSLLAVLFNRTVSGIAPVADASRAWESLSNVTCCRSLVVIYDGICILQIGYADVSDSSGGEPVTVDADKLMDGSLYKGVAKSGSQSYLANLSLYPGKSELPFLPPNTQAVILQPLGNKGIAIVGGDMIRGFTTSDQAWITLIGEKLDATLSKVVNRKSVTVQDKI
ncbi:hypothetical protein PHJA_001300100 [Phtheirospermum japonicum]|uniref:Uncharacterized protein n=1 Tax=Phtheirospermum japonicum TaxID=374723 RepID=A0A830CBD7_9LAMI|nr:hypothetical protein PHJA_001300100 [Phtheirospermum japonicum]